MQMPPCQRWAAVIRDEELSSTAHGTSQGRAPETKSAAAFFPAAPRSLAEMHVSESEVEWIILRCLMLRGSLKGADIAHQIGLPFAITEKILQALKAQRLLGHKSAGTLSDFTYEITDAGSSKVRHSGSHTSYCGTVPVSLDDYAASVAAQSLSKLEPQVEDLKRAFADLTLSAEMFGRIGLAICRARASSCTAGPATARRASPSASLPSTALASGFPAPSASGARSFASTIPAATKKCRSATGEDHRRRAGRPSLGPHPPADHRRRRRVDDGKPGNHHQQGHRHLRSAVANEEQLRHAGDRRFRPPADRSAELLNRWIVPLEKRHDYLGLPSGRKIRVPFDQFMVFSTNLEPQDLVDEAFLRRIPYKIESREPQPRAIPRAVRADLPKSRASSFDAAALDHLMANHY